MAEEYNSFDKNYNEAIQYMSHSTEKIQIFDKLQEVYVAMPINFLNILKVLFI